MKLARLVAIVALVFIAGAAFAEVKWEQYPHPDGNAWMAELDTCPNGWTAELADDFECLDGGPITAVEWWGTDLSLGSLPDHYIIRFYSDIPDPDPGNPLTWSKPGDLLYEEECWVFTAEWDPDLEQWRFYQDLAVPFCQELGTIYWFSVVGVVCTNDGEGAGWCDCFTVPQWNDEAVIRSDLYGVPDWTAMSQYAGWVGHRELSFVLHGGPGGANVLCDPDPEYLTATDPTKTVAVKYLGCASGSLWAYNVTFSWDDAVVSTPTTFPFAVTEGDLLSSAGTTVFMVYDSSTTGHPEITVDCTLTGGTPGVTGPGTMFTIDFTGVGYGTSPVDVTVVRARDQYNVDLTGFVVDDGELQVDITNPSVTDVAIENLTLSHTDEYAKDTDDLELTATVTDDYSLSASDITADFSALLVSGGSAVTAEDYTSDVATWTTALTNVTLQADGLKTVTVTATDGLGNSGSGSDDITADNTPPDPISGFDAAPAHGRVELSWGDPSGLDVHFYGVKVQYDAWDDYPYYDDPAPLYPMDHTSGDGTAYDSPGLVMYWEHTESTRDIYYYTAFAYDWALNYSSDDPGAQDRATNYWLGDVALSGGGWGYDGYVGDQDIDKLAGAYTLEDPTGNDAECDVGPTDDHSRVGIPEPDDLVQFEDLMIFAMNYDVVEPLVAPALPVPSDTGQELALSLSERSVDSDGELEVALALEGNVDEVKGLSAELLFDATELEFVSARLSDAMSTPVVPVFFWHGAGENTVQLDVALLGTGVTVGGSGDVVVLTFRVLSEEYSIEFGKTALRGADNEELNPDLEGYESKPELPTVFRLFPNVPNPFARSASIAYHVPHRSDVSIRIYDVSGRLVRTLVGGATDPGRHLAVWDGRSDSGESVGSGVYFCTMEADEYAASRKMMLLK